MVFDYDLAFHIYLTGYPSCNTDFCRSWYPPFSMFCPSFTPSNGYLTSTSQAARDVRASYDIIANVFESIVYFFRRL